MNKIKHIQGLRALAVIAVVIFHISPDLLKGGYLGVDIFFVISGYIITKLLIQNSYQGFNSLKKFYADRIVRLLPNYVAMVLFTTVLAYWVLNPYDLIQYAKSLQFSGIYVTNVVLSKQQSYFDISRELKPLLHTWSLSIEWQFYAIAPIAIILVKKLLPKRLGSIILIVLLTSFLYKLYLFNTNQNIAFYSFFGRVWQLLIGAYIANNESLFNKLSTKTNSYLALTLLIICLAISDESNSYQIYLSVIACMATGMLIVPSQANHLESSLCQPIAIGIGDMSYAIYLWHWPIIVLIKNLNLFNNFYLETGAILLVIIVFSSFSYHWIENIVRQNKGKISLKISVFSMLLSILVFAGIGHYYYSNRGLEERFPHAVAIKENRLAYNWQELTQTPLKILPKCQVNEPIDYFEKTCGLGAEKKIFDFLILGDSHLEAITPALHASLLSINAKGMIASLWGCPPFIGVSNYHGHLDVCQQLNYENQLDRLIEKYQPKNIILVGFWNMYLYGNQLNGRILSPDNFISIRGARASNNASQSQSAFFESLSQTAQYVQNKNIKLFILEDVPTLPRRIQDLPKNFTHPVKQHKANQQLIRNELISLRQRGILIQSIDLSEGLCNETDCFSYLNDHYLYWDHNHLTPAGASLTIPILKKGLMNYKR